MNRRTLLLAGATVVVVCLFLLGVGNDLIFTAAPTKEQKRERLVQEIDKLIAQCDADGERPAAMILNGLNAALIIGADSIYARCAVEFATGMYDAMIQYEAEKKKMDEN